MVVVKLIGGLGNQLFQYATARRVAYVNNAPLKLDISGFEKYTLRRYSLHHFNISADIASSDEIALSMRKGLRQIFSRLTQAFQPYDKHSVIRERSLNFDPRILKVSGEVCLEGYWASEKYFKDIEPVIRKELTIKTAPSAATIAMAERIGQVQAVSVHIRRTDFVSDPSTRRYHDVCSLDYYNMAVDRMAQIVGKPHFFVFSDDPPWAREHFRLDHPVTFVTHNNAETDYDDLRLMSLCKHHIIANSTFSWWGAWLSGNADRVVIVPKRWLTFARYDPGNMLRAMIAPRRWLDYATYDARDLFPEGWIRL